MLHTFLLWTLNKKDADAFACWCLRTEGDGGSLGNYLEMGEGNVGQDPHRTSGSTH